MSMESDLHLNYVRQPRGGIGLSLLVANTSQRSCKRLGKHRA